MWVVRVPGNGGSTGGLEALVFECFGEDNVKELYRNFLEVSKRSKLERHRRRRSEGGSGYQGYPNGEDQVKSQNVWHQQQQIQQQPHHQQQQPQSSRRQQNNGVWNLVRHTDRNGITHIEVESQRRQLNGSGSDAEKIMPASKKKTSEKSKFAKELESILSKELENRRNEGTRSMIGSASPASSSKIWGPRSAGEPQSLRQRAPALLLRKLDEFEEMAHRVWAGAPPDGDMESDNRKVWQRPDPSKAAARTPPPSSRRSHDVDGRRRERLDRLRAELMQQKSEENAGTGSMSSATANATAMTPASTAASAPPAAAAPTTAPVQTTPVAKKEADKQILIPTKTGKEPVKKLYPKESPPDPIRARFVPVAIPIQFATAQQFSAQPLSLPIYPVQVAPVAWARYPGDFNDPNNNMNQMPRSQWTAARVQVVPEQAFAVRESRGRSRDRIDGDSRRRAQSKSPARRAAASSSSSSSGYLDNVASDMSELSKKFREFGDIFRQRMSRKTGNASSGVPVTSSYDVNGQLKSNLKKQPGNGNLNVVAENLAGNSNSSDNKKVHFNKFATVQMMD